MQMASFVRPRWPGPLAAGRGQWALPALLTRCLTSAPALCAGPRKGREKGWQGGRETKE